MSILKLYALSQGVTCAAQYDGTPAVSVLAYRQASYSKPKVQPDTHKGEPNASHLPSTSQGVGIWPCPQQPLPSLPAPMRVDLRSSKLSCNKGNLRDFCLGPQHKCLCDASFWFAATSGKLDFSSSLVFLQVFPLTACLILECMLTKLVLYCSGLSILQEMFRSTQLGWQDFLFCTLPVKVWASAALHEQQQQENVDSATQCTNDTLAS